MCNKNIYHLGSRAKCQLDGNSFCSKSSLIKCMLSSIVYCCFCFYNSFYEVIIRFSCISLGEGGRQKMDRQKIGKTHFESIWIN